MYANVDDIELKFNNAQTWGGGWVGAKEQKSWKLFVFFKPVDKESKDLLHVHKPNTGANYDGKYGGTGVVTCLILKKAYGNRIIVLKFTMYNIHEYSR